MKNESLTTEHIKVLALPIDFDVECPTCGDKHPADFQEQKDGGFEVDPSETFLECSCGQLIEITGRWRNLP